MTRGKHSSLKGLVFAIAAFALFSSHDAIIKSLGMNYPVFQIIFFGMLFAFVPMAVLMLADRAVDNFRPHHPWLVAIRSAMVIIGMSSGFYAFTQLPLAEVYALLFVTPILITIFSVPLLGEQVRAQRWAAVIVGLIGVLIVLRPGASAFTLGHFAALVAALASSLGSIIIRKIGGEERSAVLILYPMVAVMVVMGASLPLNYVPPNVSDLGLFAAVGLLSVAAQNAIINAYRAAPAALVAPLQYSQILWATLFGMIFFSERPDKWVGIGAGVIISSGLFILWREGRRSDSSKPVRRVANPRIDAGPSPKPKGFG